jgi:hypothetical protein
MGMRGLGTRRSGRERAFQNISSDLFIVGSKMRSIVDSMIQYLGCELENSHLEGLVDVMEDQVAEVEKLALQLDRLSWTKAGKGPAARPTPAAA